MKTGSVLLLLSDLIYTITLSGSLLSENIQTFKTYQLSVELILG